MAFLEKEFQILIVDDNPADVQLLEMAFQPQKTQVRLHVAKDGMEALDFLYRKGKFSDAPLPDLILLDLCLPKMDGREVLKQIKMDVNLREIPVVVLTSSRSETDVHGAYQSHANAYIVKPADIDGVMDIPRAIEHFWLKTALLPRIEKS